jgi:hypothetical protein
VRGTGIAVPLATGKLGVAVAVGVNVEVGVRVGVGDKVLVGVGVNVGPNNLPGPQDVTERQIKTKIMAEVNRLIIDPFILLLRERVGPA